MSSVTYGPADIACGLLETTIHAAALANTGQNAAFSRLRFKAGEGVNRYSRKDNTIYIGSVFCHRLRLPIYARSMRLLRIAKYALKPKLEFTFSELLALEAVSLYAEFLKYSQRSNKSVIEMIATISSKEVFNRYVQVLDEQLYKAGIDLEFAGGSLSISPIPVDQYIPGDEIIFIFEQETQSGVIKRVLKNGFKVQMLNNDTITVSKARLL